jgi:hypothetical protein
MKEDFMATPLTRRLAVGATLFVGVLAGLTANRALVEIPAWQKMGVLLWTDFTRIENAGAGFILYPAVGAAALISTVAAAVAFRFDKSARGSRGLPIYGAALLAIGWSVITRALLVPVLFRLRDPGLNPSEMRGIFATFARWSAVNDVLHVLTFGLSLWALTEVLSSTQEQLRGEEGAPVGGFAGAN